LNAEDFISKMEEKNILLTPMGDGKIRIVTHLDFSDQMLEKLLFELKRF
jgi:threonine aldolase